MATVTCVDPVQSPWGLLTVQVKVVVSYNVTVDVVWLFGLTTLSAGSQWKLNEPCVPALAVKVAVPPYITVLGVAVAVGVGCELTGTLCVLESEQEPLVCTVCVTW